MKATHLGLVLLGLIGACAQQEDAPSTTTCNPNAMVCSAGAPGTGGAGTAGAGGNSAGGMAAGGAPGGGATPGAGAPGAGAPSAGGAPGGGAPAAGGAPGAGAPAGGAPAGGAPQAGAPAGGAPQAGAPAGGAPAGGASGNTVVIETNRSDGTGARFFLKVVPPNNYLQWTGTSAADAEVFQEVFVGTDQVKLLATSVNKYVTLDQAIPTGQTKEADYLIANQATVANAAVLNIALCAGTNAKASKCAPNCRGIQVMADDDVDNFVVSDDQFTLTTGARARSNTCGTGATDWESWEFVPH